MAETSFYTKPPEVLYHYCSVPTFYNIIKNKSIWLSDISKSNDSEELRWYLRSFKAILDKAWNLYIEQRQKHGKNDDPEIIGRLHDGILNAAEQEQAKCWAFCLSEKEDDLGQWRGYADNGAGVAIGLRSWCFEATGRLWMTLKKLQEQFLYNPRFGKVEYGEKAVEDWFAALPEDAPIYNLDVGPFEAAAALRKLVPKMYSIAPFYKNIGFQEEREWRLIYSMATDDLKAGNLPGWPFIQEESLPGFQMKAFCYTEKGNNLVSHIELEGHLFGNMISEIIIGPKCKLTENEVKLFLISCKLFQEMEEYDEIRICKSASSYR